LLDKRANEFFGYCGDKKGGSENEEKS